MTRLLIVGVLICCTLFSAVAQVNRKSKGHNESSLKGVPFKERIVTGGGFGMGFTSYQDYISVYPIIGYAITKKFVVGTGIIYRYTKYKDIIPDEDVSVNDWSVNPFARYTVYKSVFLMVEYEYLNYEGILVPSLETKRDNLGSFLAGGGFLQPIGDRINFFAIALYNFSYSTPAPGVFYPYDNPLILRVGVTAGF